MGGERDDRQATAAAAGLAVGDVITAVDEVAVSTPDELGVEIAERRPGDVGFSFLTPISDLENIDRTAHSERDEGPLDVTAFADDPTGSFLLALAVHGVDS